MELMCHMSMETLQQMSCTCASILMSYVKWNPRFSTVVENDMTLCPNKREVQLNFLCIYLDGKEDILFSHGSPVTCFQSSNLRHKKYMFPQKKNRYEHVGEE